ncbi:hypothetical protein BDV93DRAFT_355067 [Ceratobasidium sp. AG-I]|nr:hypothetical protein BDV93DRAFT_355067 [Ceratobasidium sp. AG-I]
MHTHEFPDEILLLIVHYLGAGSTHQLRNLALVGRRWYLIAAPVLLSTIAVSSLGDLVRLCDHLASAHKAHIFLLGRPAAAEQRHVSMIAHHTRSIIISGTWWPRNLDVVTDYHIGLDQYQPVGGGAVPPDIEIPYHEMMSKLGASIPQLKQLKSLEWYGRFPGDYYLAAYLLKTRYLSQLTLCIDNRFVVPSQSYCNIVGLDMVLI